MTLSPADRLDILDLLTRADAAASARDAAAYLALFANDAVLDGDQGNYHGRDALRRGFAEVWGAEPAGTLHLTLNPVIDADPASPTAAVARSVLLIVAPGTPRRWSAPRTSRSTCAAALMGGASPAAAWNSSPFGCFPNRERPVEKP